MRLNSALVPTLLLASVALADMPPKIIQNDDWGGASWQREGNITKWVAGRFSLPFALGIPPMGFNIVVALGGVTCKKFVLKAGITVTAGIHQYQAWGGWHSETEDKRRAPAWFTLSPRDEIGIALQHHTSTSGVIGIINFTTGKFWTRFAQGDAIDCNWQADANWVITPLEGVGKYFPMPDFIVLAFVKLEVKDHMTPSTRELDSSFMIQEGILVTVVWATASFIGIVYVPPPEE